MRKFGWIVCILMMVNPVHAVIYKGVDSAGNATFSDKPFPGAEEMELPQAQTVSSPKVPPKDKIQEDIADDESFVYEKLDILQPENEATIRNTDGSVSVIAGIEPKLRPGDKMQLIFDGSPIGELKATTEFSLRGINRGSHTIAVQVVHGDGTVLNTSKSITIFMMPPRVNMGNVRP